ncbi:hypothetical protein CJD36_008985 [Flavipsychrobacter stenotrophus]|uniref:Secretion system C-terminal sorting domain-containing protein n=1 Tax=Flavipsychrobacter stenotrophus TaxID=2077091 RepID=A0A2S7SZ76_9BACT|nr:T9SS type A sorting domain-containing protein [Flavipsychrobacter stenotrophus]PQJ11917.1 hypothetical protein CJD36_008985 [Flavipsychrobacter stenotrophus]
MKRLIITLCILTCSILSSTAYAQSFTTTYDTVFFDGSGAGNVSIHNNITPTAGEVTLNWNVVSTNFPSDWVANCGMCDTSNCYNLSFLTPSGILRTCGYSPTSANHDFHLLFNGAAPGMTSMGNYYVRVKIVDPVAMDSAYSTFVVSRSPVNVNTVSKAGEEVALYPNPATTEINLVYNGGADIKTVANYNIIGKVMAVYKLNGNSANMSLDNIPGGIYFARLMDGQGQLVATRKFTRQ